MVTARCRWSSCSTLASRRFAKIAKEKARLDLFAKVGEQLQQRDPRIRRVVVRPLRRVNRDLATELFEQGGLKVAEQLGTRNVEQALLKCCLTERGPYRLGQLQLASL